jgi:hypothetical protein
MVAKSALAHSSAPVAATATVATMPTAAPLAARFAWCEARLTTTRWHARPSAIGVATAFAHKRLAAASLVPMASPTRTWISHAPSSVPKPSAIVFVVRRTTPSKDVAKVPPDLAGLRKKGLVEGRLPRRAAGPWRTCCGSVGLQLLRGGSASAKRPRRGGRGRRWLWYAAWRLWLRRRPLWLRRRQRRWQHLWLRWRQRRPWLRQRNGCGCVGGNVARGCRGGGSKMLSHHLRQLLGSSSVRVCLNASLIRPICLRETVLPSTHRSRRHSQPLTHEAPRPVRGSQVR